MSLNINLLKSPQDKNIYKFIRLPNELDCLLISDPDCDKSAASMSVDTGDCDDPTERPGLAHFLEHMLFMGTKKYPDQNDYANYLNENSGYNNAYTSGNHTNYYLDCSNEAIEGALDRFAQFFIAPLLDQSCVDRELNAVNSENEMCIITDSWRQYLLWRMSGLKTSPYSKFPVGNLKSLQHPTIRDEVLKFYDEKYSSNRMKLCIYSKSDVGTLEQWAKTYFSDIPNKNYETRVFTEVPFKPENMQSFWKMVPIKDDDYLEFVWVYEGNHKHYKNDPLRYLSHLIGHEGENSLLSLLKAEGLATELSAGADEEIHLFHHFNVRIKLTPHGFENYKDVVSYTFQYLNMLKKHGAQKWIFEEIQKTQSMKFRFLEKQEPVHVAPGLSNKLLYYPYEDILKLGYFMDNYDEQLINNAINGLTLQNMRIILISQKCEPECNLLEEWYSVKHTFSPFEQYVKDYYEGKHNVTPKKTHRKLDLPPKNIFIPENFEVHATAQDSLPDEPKRIKEDKLGDVWFKRDNKFFVPKASINLFLYFRDASFGHSIDTYYLSNLWVKLFKYHTQELVYLAGEGNIDLDFGLNPQGFYFDVKGYNDTILIVLAKFFEKLLDFKPEELASIFKDLHYEELQTAKNFIKGKPYITARNLGETFVRTGNHFHVDKKIETLQRLNFDDFLAFHKIALQKIRFLWFFSGNLRENEVLETVKKVEDIFTTKRPGVQVNALQSHEIPEIRIVQIPDETTWVYEYNLRRENQSEAANPNSGIFQLYQVKAHSDKTRILNDILDNYLREAFFDQLRTNEQLGYVVYSRALLFRGISQFCFVIQSDVKWPFYLRQRIASFIEGLKEKVQNVSDEDYNKYIESVKTEYLQKPLQLYEEAERHWEEIKTQQYFFNRRKRYAELLADISKKDFQDHVASVLFNAPRKFEVHVVSELMKDENEKLKGENTEKLQYVTSDDAFKKRMALYPDFYSIQKP